MLTTSDELSAVVRELDQGLALAVVQKVYSPEANEVWLELRQVGRSTLMCVCARLNLERLSVAQQRPSSPPRASPFQQRLRKLLIGKRLEGVAAEGAVATLYFPNGRLRADLVRHELEWLPALPLGERQPAAPNGEFPLARALEQRVSTVVDRDEVRRLKKHLEKLHRTRAKVAAEAARGPRAAELKRDGELLARNLHAVARGAKSVQLTDYDEDGAALRTVELDPRRTPKQHVEWLFHQAKRLERGVAVARERLKKLDAEIAAAELPEGRAASTPRAPDAPSLPYREYVTKSGRRIWVGRGAAHNDALTFRVAKPHHVWLHARGVPGAHVVVPLEKKQELDQETLLDAAHLAFHHSDLKGEPQGEVSYTQVKHVRRAGAPGAVHFTRETTFWLRVEPQRLSRLLEARSRA